MWPHQGVQAGPPGSWAGLGTVGHPPTHQSAFYVYITPPRVHSHTRALFSHPYPQVAGRAFFFSLSFFFLLSFFLKNLFPKNFN